jgi:methylated-DNA-[protein]-cysteine S-methyltransferase
VTTYKEIGNVFGKDGNIYRAIGQALNKNPFAPKVPCHRVVSSDGSLGGFAHGTAAKIALLEKEGVAVVDGKIVDFERKVWRF